jgi:hypothetical protein
MFDDEEEEGMEEDGSQMDTEIDIDVTDIAGEDVSLKRKSPPTSEQPSVLSLGSVPETCPEGIFNEDSSSQSKKLKLKVQKTPKTAMFQECIVFKLLCVC